MTPIALTKIQDAFDKLSPYLNPLVSIDEMTLRRIKNDVVRNLPVDPHLGYMALGNIALLEWDEEGLDSNYGKALRLQRDSLTLSNYATALQVLGKFVEALSYVQEASDLTPTDLALFREVIRYTSNSGYFTQAAILCEKYNIRSPKQRYPEEEGILSANSVVLAAGLDEALLAKCNAIAFEILRERRTSFFSIIVETDKQDNCILYFITLPVSAEKVDELDRELGERLFDQVPDFDPSKYWVGYTVHTEKQQ